MTPGEAIDLLEQMVWDNTEALDYAKYQKAIASLREYRNPDAEALAACVAELVNLENAMHGTAEKIGRLLTRFSDYAGRSSVTPPRRLT